MFTIYFDMDGVLCDFDKRCNELDCWRQDNHRPNWKKMKDIGPTFWSGMDKIQTGLDLLELICKWVETHPGFQVGILSAIHLFEGKIGKRAWLKKYCPQIDPENVIIINNGNFKYELATTNSCLVDDKLSNVENYISAGGKGIHFDKTKTIHELFNAIMKTTYTDQ